MFRNMKTCLTAALFVVAFLAFSARSASAAAVYYSVGQSSSTKLTGTPTITISSNVATFTTAQTGNIGVGDRVTYGRIDISSFADQGGGVVRITTSANHGFSTGDYVNISGTTNYNGTYAIANAATNVFDITHSYTAEAGGATKYSANIAYIASKTSTTVWTLTGLRGASISDRASATTVNSITREYTSLNAAEAGAVDANHLNTADLAANSFQLNFPCYYDTGADTTAVTVDGYTTDATNYIKIYTPFNTSTEANITQRHQGTWSILRYALSYGTNAYTKALYIQDSYVRVEGLQVEHTNATADERGGIFYNQPNITITGNIVRLPAANGVNDENGINGAYTADIYNNIVWGWNACIQSNNISAGATQNISNNTVSNCNTGIAAWGYPGSTTYYNLKNNLGNDSSADFNFDLGGNVTRVNQTNLSSDNSSPNSGSTDCGGHSCRNQTVAFADTANGDYHLSPSDTAAKNAGTDLSSDSYLPITTDIDGQTRPTGTNVVDIGADEGATAVYYSVGQNTNDHSIGNGGATCSTTGACTLTISSGTATFNYAQTATNLGVGDKVTYNTTSVAYISQKISQTQWKLITATGGTPADVGTAQTVNSIAHTFGSLNAAEAGADDAGYLSNANLVTSNYQLNLPCYYDTGADTTAVTVDGYTTALPNYIRIYTPNNTSTEVNQSQRHQGKWDDGKYNLSVSSGHALTTADKDVQIDGLQIAITSATGEQRAIFQNAGGAGGNYKISNNILKGVNGSGYNFGIYTDADTASISMVFNNIVYDIGKTNTGACGFRSYYDEPSITSTVYLYNNTFYNNYHGIYRSGNIVEATNNIAYNNTDNYRNSGGWDSASTNNLSGPSSDSTIPATNARNGYTVNFADSANEDYHLLLEDAGAKNFGADLSVDASFVFSTDIDNHTRPAGSAWDIGADEGAIAVYYSVGQNTTSHETGAGTVTVNATARTATFSVAQIATNMGVGDLVTYTGGSCYITSKTSTSVWGCQSATGTAPTAVTDADVTSIAHAFTSLSAAVNTSTGAGGSSYMNTTDLVSGNYILNIPCYYDSGADTNAVTIDGYTTGALNYIKIYTPNSTTAEVNQSQRHQGKWDASRYSLETSLPGIYNWEDFVRIDGIQIKLVSPSSSVQGFISRDNSSAARVYISNSIIDGGSNSNSQYGIVFFNTANGGIMYSWNNVVYNFTSGSGFDAVSDTPTIYAFNNSAINNSVGIRHEAGTFVAKNNIASSNTTDYSGTLNAASTNNISSDATSPNSGSTDCGGHSCRNQTVAFADIANNDYHLFPSDTAAKNAGADLSADANLAFATDIDGQTRSASPGWDIGADEAANAVYYSVGQDATTNLMSGTPTLTITAGAGVFSAAQTGNIGVGDRVTYNTSSVAYIAAKTNSDGMHWTLVTALGAPAGDVTDATVNSITREYTSLNAAEAGSVDANHLNSSDLYTNNYQLNFPCYYDTGADTTAVTVDGFTTGVSNYIKIYTPVSIATEANLSQRHQGKWDDAKYNINNTTTWRALRVLDDNIKIDGLQIYNRPTSGYDQNGISVEIGSLADAEIKNNIVRYAGSNGTAVNGILLTLVTGSGKIYDNIVYDVGGNGISSDCGGNALRCYFYNNTVVNSATGYNLSGYQDTSWKNNIAQNCTNGFNGNYYSDSDYNISDVAADAPGTNSKNSTTVLFADRIGKDFHLATNDTAARNAGTDLSADANFAFATDIDGHTRPNGGTWDIGADEGATAVYYSVGQNTASHETGAGTVTVSGTTATFTEAQTATNMGVGDLVTYTGGSCYISGKTSTTVWSCVSATGGTPTAASGADVTSIAHAFSSLSAAVNTSTGAGGASYMNTTNMYTSNYQLNIPCYYDTSADTTAVSVSGYTTALPNYIKIYTPNNTSTEVNQSQRHQGKWDEERYRIEVSNSNGITVVTTPDVVVDGIQVKITYTSTLSGFALRFSSATASSHYVASNNILWGLVQGSPLYYIGISANNLSQPKGSTFAITNNVIYGFSGSTNGWATELGFTNTKFFVYANTIYDTYRGLYRNNGTNTVYAKNNIVQNSTVCFDGTFDASSSNNIANDTTAPGANSKNSTAVSFIDAANDDYHLAPSDTAAKGSGTNLGQDTYLNFQDDIDAQQRTGIWDIGADQFFDGSIQTPSVSSSSISSGLVGYWSFNGEDVSGTTAYDRSGNNNNGTNSGATPTLGKLGQGMSFNGTSSNIAIANNSSLKPSLPVTLSAWFRTEDAGVRQNIITTDTVSPYYGIWLQVSTTGKISISYGDGGTPGPESRRTKDGATTLSANTWYNVTVVINGPTDINIYLNGVDDGGTYSGTGDALTYSTGEMFIGQASASNSVFDGSIDEVRMYNRALSADEVTRLYNVGQTAINDSNNTRNTSGLVGLWSFDGPDVSGTTAYDRSGQSNNGTIAGATPVLGKLGQSLSFNGTSNYVGVADSSSLNPSVFSVSFWVNMPSTPSSAAGLIGHWGSASAYRAWDIRWETTNKLLFAISDGGSNTGYNNTANSFSLGNWHNIVATYNAGTFYIYVDGVLESTSLAGGTNPTGALNASPGTRLIIGATCNDSDVPADPVFFSQKSMDDVRIYNRVLSASEVGDLYRAGTVEIGK